ncbi:AsmA-like C-terminal region-containing protein [Mesorhizobium sp. BAC0120]|uniref:AsmA family protein n=1 Tax=Mesorhizobium sp. BAC0120 TaxID=3090670 RepID=UPI00298D490E|nr:AsmA-like C-terminal region-containing protein [Mesorhizobium sp. BAC0120]
MIRKSIWGLIAAAIVAAMIVAVLPLIASTRIVQDRIALEMSAWSGYRVELGAAPDIQIWPSFKAVLNDVSLSDWEDSSRRPVLDAETVELELSPIAALRGNIVFSRASLVRPVLYVTQVAPNRYAPTAPKIGRIWHAIEKAREVLAKNPTNPNLSALSDESFGTVEFSDGQVMDRNGGNNAALITGLAGAVEWSALNSKARLRANGVWRGENFSVEAASAQPLILFAGGSAPVSVNVKAAPAAGHFDGVANLSQNSFFNGQVAFNSPSLRRMLEWSRNDLPPGAASGPVALSGKITGDRRRLRLEDAQITLDGNPASGVLELSLADAVPGFVGTLAFDQFDLRAFLSAFTPFVPGSDGSPSTIDVAFAEKYNLDLRLSANRATAGDLVFTGFAATAQVRGDLAAFDISDSTIFGGTVQAGLRYDRKGDNGNLDVRLLASDVDTAAAATLAKSLRTTPSGKATVSLMLKGPAPDWNRFLQTAAGSFSMTFGPGTVNGFDIGDFINRFKQGGFFPLADVAPSTLNVDRAEVRATLADGTARLEKAEATLGPRRLTLTGVVPYSVGGIALSGALIPVKAAADDPNAAEASFFVGGSWAAPFVSPIFSDTYFDRPRIGQND